MATHTEQLAKVVKTNTDLTTAITGELDKWQAQRNSAKDELQKAVGAVVDNKIDLYVDAESGDDSNSGLSIATSLKTLDKALSLISKASEKIVRVFLKGGHTYQITSLIYLETLKVSFYTLGIPELSVRNETNLEEFQAQFATIENIVQVDESKDYQSNIYYTTGIRSASKASQSFYFHKVILKTPSVSERWKSTIWTGLIHRSDFSGQANVVVVQCYLDLGSPLAKSASGVGFVNFDSYFNQFNLTRLIESPLRDNYVVATSTKYVKCHFGGVYYGHTEGLIGDIRKYLVECYYNTSNPDAEPRNVISNLDLRRSQTLRS